MAFDINAIRNKLAKLQGKTTGTSYWRPSEASDSQVRLLSFKTDDGLPFKEFYFYYNIGKSRGILAPNQFGKPDPIQELINKLREEDAVGNKDLLKKLYPKMRVYAPVIVRGEEEKGIQLWGFGKMVYEQLYTLLADDEIGDFTDPYTGRDITVSQSKTPGRQWATTTVRPRLKQTQLHKDEKQMKEWIDAVPDTNTLFELEEYDIISKKVNDWINGEDSSSDGTSRNFDTSTKETSSSGDSTFKSLDDAFSSLS